MQMYETSTTKANIFLTRISNIALTKHYSNLSVP